MKYIVVENNSRDADHPNYDVMGIYSTINKARQAIKDSAIDCVDDGDIGKYPDPMWGSDCIIAKVEQTVRPAPYASKIVVELLEVNDD